MRKLVVTVDVPEYNSNNPFTYKCEDESMDHSIMVGGSQKSLDDLICESDICFVIFCNFA